MSFIINIDTSLETASVSISKDGVILSFQINEVQREHASFVHIAIKELLAKEKLTVKNLSYTGLRVGLAAAKGLCYALNIPLITVSTLQMMAKDAMMNDENATALLFCSLIDARRMEVFTAIYDRNMVEILPPNAQILTPQSFADILKEKKIMFFGSGMIKWKAISTEANALFCESKNVYNALNIISFNKFLNLDFSNLIEVLPQYTKAFCNA
jgi:tRNA threonylcarbamoyladenosine biosynthesis protein TsaB